MTRLDLLCSAAVCATIFATPALAQGTATAAEPAAPAQEESATEPSQALVDSGEILVTARRRAETAFDTPVVLQAVGAAELNRRSIVNVEGLSRVTPLLIIGENSGGIQGAPIAIRGIAGSDVNPLADQAVSFNIDGIQINRSTIARLGTMDLASAEILKGPQALFYGKNSPGGIISLRTADPTREFDSRFSAGYEFKADEIRLEGYVAGPITENLGFRLAGYFSDMKGYIRNDAQPAPGELKSFDRAPVGHEFAARATLKFEPSDSFDARFKLSYGEAHDKGHSSQVQVIACSGPVPQLASPLANCRADGQTSLIDPGPAFQAVFPTKEGGKLFSDRNQLLTSLEMNIRPAEDVTLTSLTGFYRYHSNYLGNISGLDRQSVLLALPEQLTYNDLNQEFRVLTSFDALLNFSAGAAYQSAQAAYHNQNHITVGGRFLQTNQADLRQTGDAYSVFGQLILKPTESIELSGGGRYSHEEKRLRTVSFGVEQLSARPQVSFSNFSPEFTAKWSATPDLNLFASYRSGFLSGGFNGNGAASYTGRDLTFRQQTAKGGEVGLKARLFDRALRINLSFFDYQLRGLQVSATQGLVVIQTNAGKAYTRGVELDGNWSTPIEGLNLRGAISYNKARYKVFPFTCYRGQSIAEGCNLAPINGVFTLQSLAGQQIVRAPEWGGAAGFNYEAGVSGLKLGISGDANYSGGYFNNSFNEPLARQKSYWLFDANVRVGADDDRWEVALVGRNLTNEYYVARAAEQPFSGGVSGTAVANRQADILGVVNRGREIMIRLTVKPHLF